MLPASGKKSEFLNRLHNLIFAAMAELGTDTYRAAGYLQSGQLVAIPTETVYGLAGNALDAVAVVQIFEVKQRPSFDPLIVHLRSSDELDRYADEVPPLAQALAAAFWPGPLTLVLPKKDIIPDLVSAGLPTAGFRVPAHALTLELLNALDFPLAAPSANPFGYISPTTAQHVVDQLGEKVPYVLDGGACSIGLESTIVGFDESRAVVYRLGGLSIERLRQIAPDLEVRIQGSSNPAAPGMLLSHYAPRKKMVLGELPALMAGYVGQKIAVLSFKNDYSTGAGVCAQEVLSASGDLDEAALHLFAAMRRLDNSAADIILVEKVPDTGLGRAINDRLQRAAFSEEEAK